MSSDRTKIDYAKSVLRRKYTGAIVTAGPLVVATLYQIVRFQSGDDFRNVGASSNSLATYFIATGTTPTTWTHGSRLAPFALADLKQLATDTFADATETVTITSTSFEGGSAGGQIAFPKDILGVAIEELIAEIDPDYIITPPPLPSGRPWGATVRLGC